MRLIYKLIILAACIGVPLALTAIIFTNITKEALELKIRERHLELAENFGSEIDSFFVDFQKYVSTFLYNSETVELDEDKLRDYLSTLMIQFEDFRILTVMLKNGDVSVQLRAPWEIPPSSMARHVSLIKPEKVIRESIVDISDAYVD